MTKDDRLYLDYILECIERVENYLAAGRESFFEDHLVQDAVLRNLHTLPESTMRLSRELREANPHIPWKGMAGFRQVVVHNYLGLSLETAWTIITTYLPPLKGEIRRLLDQLGG